ncbi:MAG: hydrogenase formation protein HypD [Caldimicrobium sp.]|nr:hydrogenase formation protein HypD [Caldimicrobium sp.]MCX7873379.1 hydrogenase formation protein HypD [Caldimicrobium sp.]MDW8093791.1 hydrogenase formation protein HypD [Caldimicrobium sp.]
MKQVFNDIRDSGLLKGLIKHLKTKLKSMDRPLRIMEFCGGHTHSLLRFGLDELLSPEVEFLHGPGCPVCVLSESLLEYALGLAKSEKVLFVTYGDLLRVPNSKGQSLLSLRAQGYEIKILSHAMEAFTLAKINPQKTILFFAIGFETTAPATAFLIQKAHQENLRNLLVVSNHLLSTAVLEFLLSKETPPWMDGIIGPGHVSTVIGSDSFQGIAERFKLPIVIAGFEPLDLVVAVHQLVDLCLKGKKGVYNAYQRAVTPEGNLKAKALLEEVFVVREIFPWRGLGDVPNSALAISERYSEYDGERIYPKPTIIDTPKGCICNLILQAKAKPIDCSLFGRVCTPSKPIGPCMVSSEGACLAYHKFKSIS